jgi:transcriptional regulator with XRE-family HTH domain
MIFLPVQCRMARAALGWGVRDLAAKAKVSLDTVVRFEGGDLLKERTIEALQRVFEQEGLEFTNGDQPGVRFAKPAAPHEPDLFNPVKPRFAARRARADNRKSTEEKE